MNQVTAKNFLSLIKEMPVKWKKLGEVAELQRGRVMSKNYLSENAGEYPVYSSQTANNGEIGQINTYDFDGEFINWTTDGANAGTIFYRKGKFSITNVSGLITLNDNSRLTYKFLYFWLYGEAKKHVYSGMGNPKLMSHQVEKIPIPIPPLPIQHEIIRILDTFTALTDELTDELTAREKQYNYYRDQLLSFDDPHPPFRVKRSGVAESIEQGAGSCDFTQDDKKRTIKWKRLGEATEIKRGKRLVKSQLSKSGNYAVYQNSMTPLGYYHESNVKADTAFIICAGAAGEIGYSSDNFWAADDVYFFLVPETIKSKFLYYFLLTQQHKILAQVRRASIPRLSKTVIDRLIIPIPPLSEQARIVAILDKFDALTSSISEGLPREIELRQKQYEYYRAQLLNFPKPGAMAG